MFASVVINMFQLLVGLSYHFMMNKAYYFAFNTPSQNDITIYQSNHFSEKEQLIQTPDDSRKFNCRQHLTNKMCNPDRCCQVRKTKGNREHRDEFNIYQLAKTISCDLETMKDPCIQYREQQQLKTQTIK